MFPLRLHIDQITARGTRMRCFSYTDHNTKKIRFLRSLRQRIEDIIQERDSFTAFAIAARQAGDWDKLAEARDVLEALSVELAGLHAVAVASTSDPDVIREASDWKDVTRALRAECLLLKQEIETEFGSAKRPPVQPGRMQRNALAA
jgi:hypothetical protein